MLSNKHQQEFQAQGACGTACACGTKGLAHPDGGEGARAAKRALIVVDVQNDFLPGGSLAVPEGDEIIPTVNRLIANFETVVLTADWHPATHASFAVNHPGRSVFETIEMPYGEQVLWPAHCVAGTAGAAFAPTLATDAASLIVRKGCRVDCDSYSGFLEADRVSRTGLAGWLKDRGVTEVFVCGLALDFCVSATAVDAAREGFATTIVVDVCRAINTAPEAIEKLEQHWAGEGVAQALASELVHCA